MEIPDMYSEVYEILNILGEEYINKLPKKLYMNISNYRNKNNTKKFYIDRSIQEQDLNQETLEFITFLDLKYWCNDNERQVLMDQYEENQERFEEKKT